MHTTLLGLYSAKVVATDDPSKQKRLSVHVSVPHAHGVTGWAMPCTTYNSSNALINPPIGANVWVMFKNGDPSCPVWLGWCPT